MKDTLRVALTLEQCWHEVPGGTAIATIEAAKALLERADIELIGVAARHRHPPPAAWRPPVEVRHLGLPRLALYESWHRLRRPEIQRATGPVDVVHASTLAIPPRSAPLVVTIHDLAFVHHPQMFTPRGVSFFTRGLELALRDADLVLCPSEATRRDCEKAGFETDRLRVVPHGVAERTVEPAQLEAMRERHGLDRPYVLWTGTVEPRKNLAGLLGAWREVDSDAELILVGPTGWNEDLEARVQQAGERVRLLGFLPHDDLAPLYAGAHVFCWPSFMEGFGLPVLEAMAQGTPVITSRGTSTEELARDAGLLVDPNDPGDIAGAITRVLEDPLLAQQLRDAGRRRAREYSWTRSAALTVAAYQEVA
ncbi:MAG: glycosyltransferase family 4 protein [Actinomycetota bacterium]